MKKTFSASAIAALGLAAALLAVPAAFSAEQPVIPAGETISTWVENGQNGRYLLQLLEGGVPAGETAINGTILSDTDCAPDADGINHCKNEIRLEDGSVLKGVNNHRMSVNRCLKPGEAVTVSPLADGWAVVLIEDATENR
ncbi:hypothetical protein FF124_14345 [Martelella lutilitoris]|uniref:Uncharacterized protein n=1 Tax=Martelella lutilitoris TaxID=2583532 RepID=A0A5C4JPK8_9HYPH|nr:hypothetical protein [Martelella lutilitoris]TNB47343.1 hypothetical protein FF124_14345 [Martelella lutilitoris]